MLYAIANLNWTPGEPLTPSMARSGLSRLRPKLADAVAGLPVLAVALRYDETRGHVVADGNTARGRNGPWSAPAIVDSAGGVMVLAPIPAALVRIIGAAEIRVHRDSARGFPRPHLHAVRHSPTLGRVRTVDGCAVAQKKRVRLASHEKCASHSHSHSDSDSDSDSEPGRPAGGGRRTKTIVRLGVHDSVREGTGTTTAFQAELEAHPGARPPPSRDRDGLRLRVVNSVLKRNEDA